MTQERDVMQCEGWRDDMLDVLYGEVDTVRARRVDDHLRACAACRGELESLTDLRRDLAVWTLPSGFGVRGSHAPRRWRPRAWAVAAGLVLAVTGALAWAGAELRVGSVAFRIGRPAPEPDLSELLARRDARHRQELAALQASLAPPRDDQALLERVAGLIRESEARQAGRLSARLAEHADRVEAQRRYDLARISAGLSFLDGKTGQHVARTTELMGYVLQASQKR